MAQSFRQLTEGFKTSVIEGREFSDHFCGAKNYDPICRGFYGMVLVLGGGLRRAGSALKISAVEAWRAKDSEKRLEEIGTAVSSVGAIAGILVPAGLSSTGIKSSLAPQAVLSGRGGQLAFASVVDSGSMSVALGQAVTAGAMTTQAMSSISGPSGMISPRLHPKGVNHGRIEKELTEMRAVGGESLLAIVRRAEKILEEIEKIPNPHQKKQYKFVLANLLENRRSLSLKAVITEALDRLETAVANGRPANLRSVYAKAYHKGREAQWSPDSIRVSKTGHIQKMPSLKQLDERSK